MSLTGKHLPYLLDIVMLALPFYGVGHSMRMIMLKPIIITMSILLFLGLLHLSVVRLAFPYSACFAANDLFSHTYSLFSRFAVHYSFLDCRCSLNE